MLSNIIRAQSSSSGIIIVHRVRRSQYTNTYTNTYIYILDRYNTAQILLNLRATRLEFVFFFFLSFYVSTYNNAMPNRIMPAKSKRTKKPKTKQKTKQNKKKRKKTNKTTKKTINRQCETIFCFNSMLTSSKIPGCGSLQNFH